MPDNIREISFRAAFADYNQPEFDAAKVLTGTSGPKDGWAIGGALTVPHQLVLVPNRPLTVDESETLRITIQQNSPHAKHLLGHFRLSMTGDDTAIQRSRIPSALLATLEIPADKRSVDESATLAAYYRSNIAAKLENQRTELAKATRQLEKLKPATMPASCIASTRSSW